MKQLKIKKIEQTLAYAGVEQEIISALNGNVLKRTLKKGELFPLDKSVGMLFIDDGFIKESLVRKSGDFVTMFIWSDHQILVPNYTWYDFEDVEILYEALCDTELTIYPQKSVYQLCSSSMALFDFFINRSQMSLSATREFWVVANKVGKHDTLLIYLTVTFSVLSHKGKNTLPISMADLSSVTGCSRQHWSKLLGELRDQQIIETSYGSITCLDIKKLTNMCDPDLLVIFARYFQE
ncbi:helix-turn-helix domain-containing protein [Shewanella sp. ULN5]|uniref:Crp/Fnr family transcriptional regulator n=1 Tax=Shewanella sp. ULN5 TaxID=2994678 RepID=UPI00273E17EC|nr:helix-turn-helix domain-containing protein [Shewanella sp. ULN5]MDP5146267.1 helix-turn-helix domain-containing protein [Shewanella sp. ULN5]